MQLLVNHMYRHELVCSSAVSWDLVLSKCSGYCLSFSVCDSGWAMGSWGLSQSVIMVPEAVEESRRTCQLGAVG